MFLKPEVSILVLCLVLFILAGNVE